MAANRKAQTKLPPGWAPALLREFTAAGHAVARVAMSVPPGVKRPSLIVMRNRLNRLAPELGLPVTAVIRAPDLFLVRVAHDEEGECLGS
jgi:hypothetical protein